MRRHGGFDHGVPFDHVSAPRHGVLDATALSASRHRGHRVRALELGLASELQILPEPLGLRAADRDLRALRVLHPKDVVPAEPRDYLLDLVDIDEVRPMNAPEHVRVQTRLQLVEGSVVGRPRHLPCNYVNRLIGQRRIDDLFGLHKQEPFAHPDGDLIASGLRFAIIFTSRSSWSLTGSGRSEAQPSPGPGQRLFQAGRVDRLQKVVDRVDLECLDGVLIERGDEHECR